MPKNCVEYLPITTMNSQDLRVILDDNTGDIQYSGGDWIKSNIVQWYQATSTYPASAVFGSLRLAFEGTSIAFIGNTPDGSHLQFATISIDGGTAYNSSYGSRNVPQSYIQWYQSPILPDGKHTIEIDNLDTTAVDIVIITVGPTTSLANRMVFVDNNDPAIEYTGDWTENGNRFKAGHLPDGYAVGNTTQRSTTVGDIMTFRFSGTSISIYGLFSWTNIGNISVAYTLDGIVEMQSYSVTESSHQYTTADGEATNFLFFEKDAIPPGDHTLIMNITDILNQTFSFDYLVYSPSFSSLATMPNLTSTTTMSSASSTSKPSPNSSSFTAAQTRVTSSQGNKASATSLGITIGEAVGGTLVLIGLAVIAFLYLRNRHSKVIRAISPAQRSVSSTNDYPSPQMTGLVAVRPTSSRFASLIDHIPRSPTSTSLSPDQKQGRAEYNPPRRGASPTSLSNTNMARYTMDTDELEYASS
ncbi:hypothetical protein BJ912DRAFT_601602 [Pholiota molesta]|nr:hypothetical protein BJ912DRAFT_601602 [Pholiota molesta]